MALGDVRTNLFSLITQVLFSILFSHVAPTPKRSNFTGYGTFPDIALQNRCRMDVHFRMQGPRDQTLCSDFTSLLFTYIYLCNLGKVDIHYTAHLDVLHSILNLSFLI